MSKALLNVTNVTATSGDPIASNVSMHVGCTAEGSAVLVFINPTGDDVEVSVSGVDDADLRVEYTLTATASAYDDARARSKARAFMMGAAPPEYLSNDSVFLNGQELVVDAAGILPPLDGKNATGGPAFVAPMYSYGFVVYPNVSPPACGLRE